MEIKKEEIIPYIKHFDNIFNTDILNNFDMNKLTLFFSIYEKMKEDLCTPTEEYLKIQTEKSKILEKILKNTSKENIEDLNNFLELNNKSTILYEKQMIIFMYMLINNL